MLSVTRNWKIPFDTNFCFQNHLPLVPSSAQLSNKPVTQCFYAAAFLLSLQQTLSLSTQKWKTESPQLKRAHREFPGGSVGYRSGVVTAVSRVHSIPGPGASACCRCGQQQQKPSQIYSAWWWHLALGWSSEFFLSLPPSGSGLPFNPLLPYAQNLCILCSVWDIFLSR